MADIVKHIRGDTFRVVGQFTGGDYTGWTGMSQVRDEVTDELLSSLQFAWVQSAQGRFMTSVLKTDNWPANKYVLYDVQIESPQGEVRSSGAVRILVERDVARANP